MDPERRRARELPLTQRQLTYHPVGATSCAEPAWSAASAGFRRLATTVLIGEGEDCWTEAGDQVLRWAVKTRSGFRVAGPPGPVQEGDRRWISAAIGPLEIREPVQVVAVTMSGNRVGFAYGTLEGHPVSGEEAFIVHRDAQSRVWLTLRSLTRPAAQTLWRPLFPVLLLAQRAYRRRYERALRGSSPG